MLGARTISAIAFAASLFAATGVAAQTLVNPSPKADPPPAPERFYTKNTNARSRACSAYGAGFVQLPGTDACVKIGGFVRFEATGK